MQKAKRLLLISLATVLFFGVPLFLITSIGWDRSKEINIARNIVSRNRQTQIYAALLKYREKYNSLPESLNGLVKLGYLQEETIYAAAEDKYHKTKFRYDPTNFGDPNKQILSTYQDVCSSGFVETMGNGMIHQSNGSK